MSFSAALLVKIHMIDEHLIFKYFVRMLDGQVTKDKKMYKQDICVSKVALFSV